MHFTSFLPSSYQDRLDSLLFFNTQQHKVRSEIILAIESFGNPTIVDKNGSLRIDVDPYTAVQTLYVLDDETDGSDLLGAVIYTRDSTENITILHIAVDERFSSSGPYANRLLTLHIYNKVKQIAGRISGVRTLTLFYAPHQRRIPVR